LLPKEPKTNMRTNLVVFLFCGDYNAHNNTKALTVTGASCIQSKLEMTASSKTQSSFSNTILVLMMFDYNSYM